MNHLVVVTVINALAFLYIFFALHGMQKRPSHVGRAKRLSLIMGIASLAGLSGVPPTALAGKLMDLLGGSHTDNSATAALSETENN